MSSTIGKKAVRTRKRSADGKFAKEKCPATLPFPEGDTNAPKKKFVVRGFGPRPQQEFLRWMMQGASPQLACKQMKIPLSVFWKALEHDADFAAQLQSVWDSLSYDVVAALYHSAIKGNAQAQQFWLKHRPPPRWMIASPESFLADDLESLTHDELLERVRAEAPDLAVAIAARNLAQRSGFASETLPRAPESAGEQADSV